MKYLVTVTRIPGSPGSAPENSVTWALNQASGRWRGKRGPLRGPGVVVRAYGHTIVAASRFPTYGESIHASATQIHLVDVLWHAWRQGRTTGALVRWMCGGSTRWFALFDDAPTARQLCPMCQLRLAQKAGSFIVKIEVSPTEYPT